MAGVRRSFIGGGLAAILLAAAGNAVAQQAFRGWEQIQDPRFAFDPDQKVVRNFQPRAAADARELFDRAAKLQEEGQVVAALRLLQQLIDDHGSSVVQVADDRYVGAAELARWKLKRAPAEVRAAYEKQAELNGRSALERARTAGDAFGLRQVARRYANALVGQEALLALARMHRERGARELAAMHARRLLDFADVAAPGGEAKAARLAGEARALVALAEGRALDPPPSADSQVVVAGQETSLARFLSAASLAPPRISDDVWPTYGGDVARARTGVEPRGALRFDHMFELPAEQERFRDTLSPLSDAKHAPLQPIRLGDRLYVNNSLSVKCFDLLGRNLVWEFEGPQVADPEGFLGVRDYVPINTNDDITLARGIVVGLSAARGVVLANVQIPQAVDVKVHQQFRINDPCRWRGLVALDADDGRLLWEQRPLVKSPLVGRLQPADRRSPGDPDGVVGRLDVPAPPAIVDDEVFALGHFIEGAVNSYLAAIDLMTGETLYAVPLVIGQQELSMFNMPFQEFTTGVPSYRNGTVYCSTNLGLVAAVDAAFGDLRWLKGYHAIENDSPQNYFRNAPRPVLWYNRGPLLGDDLLIVTPHDAASLWSLDPATGKELWEVELTTRGSNWWPSSYLIGVEGDRLFLANSGKVFAIDLRTRRELWHFPDGAPGLSSRSSALMLAGTGVITAGKLWLPTNDEIVVLDTARGVALARERWPREYAGNVLVFRDMLVSANKSLVAVAFDPVDALAGLEAERQKAGDSLDLLTRIGSLERQLGRLDQAATTLERALSLSAGAAPDALVRARVARCGVLREIAAEALDERDLVKAETALIAAEAVADDLAVRAEIVRELLARFVPGLKDERAIQWLERLRSDFGSERVDVPDLSPRPVTVGIYTGLELAARHEARGELEQALAELERVQSDWPGEPLATSDSVTVAQGAVDALLARAGPTLRARYDHEAEAAFARAAELGDADRLALLLRRFPGAASAPRFGAKVLELMRKAKRGEDALALGAELLRLRATGDLARTVTAELARAARDGGNLSLARALANRLPSDGSDGSRPQDLADLVVPPSSEMVPGGVTLTDLGTIDVAPSARVAGGAELMLRGEPLPAHLDSVLVTEVGSSHLALIRLPRGDVAWEAEIPRPRQNEQLWTLLHVTGVVVVKRGSELLAFDLESGTQHWMREFDRSVADIATTAGVLLVTESTSSQEGREPEPVDLTGIEPVSGRQLFSVRLAGTTTTNGGLITAGDVCMAASYGKNGQVAEVFDAVSGRRLLEPRTYPTVNVAPLLLREEGLLLLPDARAAAGQPAMQQGGVQRLVAWRLGTGEKAFEFDLLPFQFKLRNVYPTAEGIAVFGGTQPQAGVILLDPRTGLSVGAPVNLPKDLSEQARRVVVVDEVARVRAQAFVDWRLREPAWHCVMLGSDGRELWRRDFAVPNNTVTVQSPDRILRRGATIAFALQLMFPGRARTDLVTLDLDSGLVSDRKEFESPQPNRRDDLVGCGDWVLLKQGATLHVLAWR